MFNVYTFYTELRFFNAICVGFYFFILAASTLRVSIEFELYRLFYYCCYCCFCYALVGLFIRRVSRKLG